MTFQFHFWFFPVCLFSGNQEKVLVITGCFSMATRRKFWSLPVCLFSGNQEKVLVITDCRFNGNREKVLVITGLDLTPALSEGEGDICRIQGSPCSHECLDHHSMTRCCLCELIRFVLMSEMQEKLKSDILFYRF